MNLKSLQIDQNESYEDNPGRYTAKVNFVNDRSEEIKLVLDVRLSEALLAFLAPALTKFATMHAQQLEHNLQQCIDNLSNQNAIEAPKADEPTAANPYNTTSPL